MTTRTPPRSISWTRGCSLLSGDLTAQPILSGYVVECALKSLYVLETGQARWGHDFQSLVRQVSAVATVAGAKTAKYLGRATSGVLTSAIGSWKPEMRYHSPSMTLGDAESWHACARDVFQETVHQMRLDGVI